MFGSQAIVFVLAVVTLLTTAHPLHHHHRRNSCRPHTSINAPSPSSAAGTAINVNVNTTSTTSTPKPTSTQASSAQQTPSLGGLLSSLFPVPDVSESWTTLDSAKGHLPLSDATFRLNGNIKDLSHNYVAAPDGKMSMQAHYPEGSYALNREPKGGISFYAPGPSDVDLTTAREATLGYSVFFQEGFEFNKGGKLPGLYGGNSQQAAADCSGGRRSGACFSTRLMWRSEGAGEFYTYLPPNPANNKQCNVAPRSDCNPTYGASVGRGAFKFATGEWTTVSERIRLNTVGEADGEIELFVNGDSVISVSGLVLREDETSKFRGIMMQTFFGGHTPDFASPKTQDAYFSDFSVAITDTL